MRGEQEDATKAGARCDARRGAVRHSESRPPETSQDRVSQYDVDEQMTDLVRHNL